MAHLSTDRAHSSSDVAVGPREIEQASSRAPTVNRERAYTKLLIEVADPDAVVTRLRTALQVVCPPRVEEPVLAVSGFVFIRRAAIPLRRDARTGRPDFTGWVIIGRPMSA
jgi:hypothetical protein